MYDKDFELLLVATFTVVDHLEQKAFECAGVRFLELPANLFAPDSGGHIVKLRFERTGIEQAAVIKASTDYPNGVPGSASYFDFPMLGMRNERILKASSLEVGDKFEVRRLPVSFWPDLLSRLRPQLAHCVDWCENYNKHHDAYRRIYDAINAKRSAETRYVCDIETNIVVIGFREFCRLWFLMLKYEKNLPAWLDLQELETV